MSRGSVLDRTPISADDWRKVGGGPANLMADALDEIARLRERIVFLQAEVDVLNGTACAEEQTRGKGPCGSCRTCRNERIEKLEKCVKAACELRFIAPGNYGPAVERFDATFAALGEVEREG